MTADAKFSYRGGNADLFGCRRAAEVVLSGPSRTGKSMAACEYLNLLCRTYDGTQALIVRKTRESLTRSGLITLRSRITPGTASWYGDTEWRYGNGSVIAAVGMNEPTRIMSSEYDVVYVQEATELTESDWEYLTTRLSGNHLPFRQIVGDCNPQGPTHWILKRAQAGKLKMLDTRHEDNPALFASSGDMTAFGAEYIAKLDNLTGVRYQRLRLGLWVAAEGMVFDEFDRDVHLRNAEDVFGAGHTTPPPDWRRFWGIDFGYTHPLVWQAWAQDPETGTLVRYAELYHTKWLVERCANEIGAWMKRNDEDFPAAIICDHDAEDRATFQQKMGVPTIPAKKSVSPGIQSVKQRLANQARLRSNGIVLVRDCGIAIDSELADSKQPTCTEEEMELYIWRDGVKDSEPVKANDDGADTMRYVTMFVDKGAIWTPEQHAAYARGDDLHGPEWGDAEPAAAGNSDAAAKEQQYLAEVEALQAAQMRGLVGR